MASKATISRLPTYLRYLREKLANNEENVSSTTIADDMRLNPINVRKDLATISTVAGKPKLGFNVKELIKSIEAYLGLDKPSEVILVGAGGLGKTLLCYDGFNNFGLKIVAAFEKDSSLFGKEINNILIHPLSKLSAIVKEQNIKLAIITVPAAFAQETANLLVASGIKGIWNFAPIHISTPTEITVKNEDLAASLAVLANKLSNTKH